MDVGIARLAGIVWLAYIGLSIAGGGLKLVPLSIAANAVYFVFAIAVFRLLSPVDPLAAFALLPLAAIGAVIQSQGQIQDDRDLQRLALIPFALFLAAIGYLLLRSAAAPQLLGIWLVLAAPTWIGFAFLTGVPLPIRGLGALLGEASEAGLVIWLLFGAS